MILSIVVAAVQEFLLLLIFIFNNMEQKPLNSEEMVAFMFATGLFTATVSLPALLWNAASMKEGRKIRCIVGIIISSITLTIGVVFLAWMFLADIKASGAVFI